MTDYTPAQRKLIEEHWNWNVDHDWYDCTIGDFCDVAKSFGIDVSRDDVQFSGFSSQGDGASFTFSTVSAYDVIMAAIKTEQSGDYGPGGYAEAFADLGKLLLDTFSPYVLTCPEGRALAESYQFNAERISRHYSHSNTVSVGDDYTAPDVRGGCSEALVATWNAMADKIDGKRQKREESRGGYYFMEDTLEKKIDEAVKAIADALYKSLNDEYDYLTSDEAVWESLEANGVEPEEEDDEDEDEDEELAEAA